MPRSVRGARIVRRGELAAVAREPVRTVCGVELLLLMKRDAARCWRPAERVAELRASTGLVGDMLQRLAISWPGCSS